MKQRNLTDKQRRLIEMDMAGTTDAAIALPPWSSQSPVKGDRFLRCATVLDRCGISKTTMYDWIAGGGFPAPIPLGGKSVAWLESEIDAWQLWKVGQRAVA
ncbi:helix-turn-helix transcriptional regulator [Chromobacterium alkanivorans]|uniref:helix-turn-helix transcriptional regulator n=1 Tax=Chromobacterium alkanivorans TaxID=1071719 RepID=UPI001F07C901|nr:AlpA family phage regulatory protein [Chromobacterium alkanivorans]